MLSTLLENRMTGTMSTTLEVTDGIPHRGHTSTPRPLPFSKYIFLKIFVSPTPFV